MDLFPDATNTGVKDGVTLTKSGSLYITEPGVTIENLDITGTIYVSADNVTIQNVRVTSSEFYVIKIASGVTGAVVQDSEINGVGTGNEGSTGIAGQGTFLRNDIYNVENGFAVQGDNTLIKDNYVHDLQASGSPHYDGIQIDGGVSDVVISHNTIINDHGQTAAVMIDNYFGPISNIKVDGNLLVGGGYTVYSDGQFDGGSITGVSFTNNHLGEGQYGYKSFVNNTPVWENNQTDGYAIAETLNQQDTTTTTTTTDTMHSEPIPPAITTTDPAKAEAEAEADSSTSTTSETTSIDSTTTESTSSKTYKSHHKHSHTHEETSGSTHNETIRGTDSGDYLYGGAGDDRFIGGLGRDIMTGGAGDDRFVFRSASEAGSNAGSRDIVRDFNDGRDTVDLSAIDANGDSKGNASFHFIAEENALFDRKEGALAWHYQDHDGTSNDRTVIQGDLDGDGRHDFEIELTGFVHLDANDFVL